MKKAKWVKITPENAPAIMGRLRKFFQPGRNITMWFNHNDGERVGKGIGRYRKYYVVTDMDFLCHCELEEPWGSDPKRLICIRADVGAQTLWRKHIKYGDEIGFTGNRIVLKTTLPSFDDRTAIMYFCWQITSAEYPKTPKRFKEPVKRHVDYLREVMR